MVQARQPPRPSAVEEPLRLPGRNASAGGATAQSNNPNESGDPMEMIHVEVAQLIAVARVYMEAASKAKPAGVTINEKSINRFITAAFIKQD